MAHIVKVARANGSAYEVHWRDAGKKRQITCKTLPLAEKELVRIEDELAAGRSTVHRTVRVTVAEVVEQSIAASAGRLKARSTDGARSVARKHVEPALGHLRISALRSRDVERWVSSLSDLSPGTIRNIYNVLNKACKYALRHGLLTVNPCTGVELPRTTSAVADARVFLTPQQVAAVADVLAQKEAHFGLLVRMAAYTGLRAGELAALRIRDINLLHRVVEVRRTVSRRTGHGWQITAPKSARSVRDVPLMRSLATELEQWISEHPDKGNPDAPLWPGSRNTGKGGELDWSATFDIGNLGKRYFRPLRDAGAFAPAGISPALRWHDLRHTYASIMAAAGRDVRLVSQWLGHESLNTTERTYVHLFRVDHGHEMDSVELFLSGAGQHLGHRAPVTALRGAVGERGGQVG